MQNSEVRLHLYVSETYVILYHNEIYIQIFC